MTATLRVRYACARPSNDVGGYVFSAVYERFYTAFVGNLTRIVTGYDTSGAPAILWRGEPPTVIHAGRYTTTELWVAGRAPIEPTDADTSVSDWALEPPPGGACFRIVEIAPDGADGAGFEPGHSDFQGAHATDTLDYVDHPARRGDPRRRRRRGAAPAR